MNYHKGTRIVSIAAPLLLSMAHATLGGAQVRTTTRDTTLTGISAMPMANGAAKMMSGPHHALAMAHGESLAAFARAVNADATKSQIVNVELARPATIEMRRNLDQMKMHHTAQMAPLGMAMAMPMTADSAAGMMRPAGRDSMNRQMPRNDRRNSAGVKPMTPPVRSDSTMGHSMTMPMGKDSSRMAGMGDMQAHMASLEKHLGMLETEVNATAPNAAQVIEHTAEIVKICGAAMGMPSDQMMGRPRAPGGR